MPSSTQELKGHQQRQKDEDERLLDALAELGGKRRSGDDVIQYGGDRLIVPEDWTLSYTVDFLTTYLNEQEEDSEFTRRYRFRPMDGALALQRALERIFGAAGIARGVMSFFGRIPPSMVDVKVGPDERDTQSVPWGMLEVPLLGGRMMTSSYDDPEYGPVFALTVYTKRKHRAQVEGLFAAIERELRERSIYKGQAINGAEEPEFIDLSGVDASKVIYSDEVELQLRANVWSLIDHSEKMRQLGMPLKRAVLFSGDYGTGKTLGGLLTALRCVRPVEDADPWTFVFCRPGVDDLATVLATARLYEPAVVFFEDIDVIAQGDREAVTRLLDMFDGITAKGTELMCLLTTNHPERIVKGMVRPGRLDAVIEFGGLDVHGIERMIGSLIDEEMLDNLDYDAIADAMNVGDAERAFLPAFAKEAIDRTVRYAMAREGEVTILSTEDFVHAALGLQPQLDLMLGAGEGKGRDTLTQALEPIMQDAARAVVDGALVDVSTDDAWAVLRANGSK